MKVIIKTAGYLMAPDIRECTVRIEHGKRIARHDLQSTWSVDLDDLPKGWSYKEIS